MILFDELGLAEKSPNNPLKVLHSNLEYNPTKEDVSFIGISNWSLDASKNNRAFILSVPDLDESLDDLIETSVKIAETFDENFKDYILFKSIIPRTYFRYKKFLDDLKYLTAYKQYEWKIEYQNIKKILKENSNFKNIENIETFIKTKKEIEKEINSLNEKNNEEIYYPSWEKSDFNEIKATKDFENLYTSEKKINSNFHGNRDYYSLIKGVAKEFKNNNFNSELNAEINKKYIERNFGGMLIEIDVDLNFSLIKAS